MAIKAYDRGEGVIDEAISAITFGFVCVQPPRQSKLDATRIRRIAAQFRGADRRRLSHYETET
jgi:hypothetical protein